jgi:cellulose synthase/poly-beta-1,6-N-acetylglucosamine synthase-like glycosyltransferase
MQLLEWLLLIAALVVSLPMLVWSVECAAALFSPGRRARQTASRRPSVTVLIPAHDEAVGIRATLESILPQLLPGDQAVVIADNCTDATAAVARECGADVFDRQDPLHRGKSFALDFGVRSLAADPRDVVIVIDADCSVDPGTLDSLARLALVTGQPVQAPYVMQPPGAPTAQHHIAALGFTIRNLARPSGMDRLGLPCFLNGTGMAFPVEVLRSINLANGKIAEDKWLTIDLALAGHFAIFSHQGLVRSLLPDRKEAERSQRKRWIHGHLECMWVQGPRLVAAAIRRRRFALLALALDLFVPPLSLLMLLWVAVLGASATAALLGAGLLPLVVAGSAGLLMAVSFAGVFIKFGNRPELGSLFALAVYPFAKLPTYVEFLAKRETKWVRTDRDSRERRK